MANWNIIRIIDEGGFGKVYEVQESNSKQQAALKELKNLDFSNLVRFQRETDTLTKFNHTHIVKIYDSNMRGSSGYGPFYVMEFMAGGSLRTIMNDIIKNSKKKINAKWALENVMLPVIDAIEYAHTQGIYHRDLKPENLLFTTSQYDCIKVADWGIGKDINRNSIALTVGGLGTPGYCSPEQWFANATVDGKTDIYSLGVIFYEMLTGSRPQIFNNSGPTSTVALPSTLKSSAPPQLDAIILKMMAYSQTNRYQTITQVKTALSVIQL
jgi:serine/threonine-protein kinase